MSSIKPQTLKGFRDFLPSEARKRQYVINTLRKVFESYGFEPLETPALEYEEVLLGKYGDEGDKLMYRFVDRGKRRVALRYDQTVPLARVVAQYGDELPMPFKRYQIQPVWRADNPQKGRYREFLQCDADIVGTSSPLADAEVIAVAAKGLEKLGFKDFKILINDREVFSQLKEAGYVSGNELPAVLRILDKVKKIGEEGVIKQLKTQGFSSEKAQSILENAKIMKENERLLIISNTLKKMGVPQEKFAFTSTLARGLDYYTGLIFEIEIEGYSAGSICGGGRYDNLIGLFTKKQIPAVGFAFGFDRLIEAMTKLKLFPKDLQTTKVLLTVFSPELLQKSIEVSSRLRSNNINVELYLDENASLEKQLKYADKKGIPYVIIIGEDEASKNMVTLKDLKNRKQTLISQKDAIKKIRKQNF